MQQSLMLKKNKKTKRIKKILNQVSQQTVLIWFVDFLVINLSLKKHHIFTFPIVRHE